MTELLFTTNDVAKLLQVDKSTVKRWTDEGKLSVSVHLGDIGNSEQKTCPNSRRITVMEFRRKISTPRPQAMNLSSAE